jgi:hypothetical protein
MNTKDPSEYQEKIPSDTADLESVIHRNNELIDALRRLSRKLAGEEDPDESSIEQTEEEHHSDDTSSKEMGMI